MNKTLTYLTILLVFGCSNVRKVNSDMPLKLDLKELNYGICETETEYIEKAESSPSGNHIYSYGFKLIKQTDRIPGKLGQKFGIEFIMKSNVTKLISVEQVWIFPTIIKDDKGKEFKELRYTIGKPTNENTYSTYTLEKEYEVVKGEWIYQMFYDGKKIYERKFYIE